MIFIVSILALLSICSGDVSHLDTDLREDGYHYKQPSQPFPPDNNGLDNQLSPDVSEPRPRPRTQPTRPVPSKPTSEYLPPDENQQASQPSPFPKFQTQPPAPARGYGPPSTFLPQTPAEPTKEYGTPTTLIPQTPQPTFPQKPIGKAHQEYGPPLVSSPRTPKPQPRPSTFAPRPGPKQPKLPLTPEREYLPPGENEINAEPRPTGAFPGAEPTSSSSVTSYPSPKFPAQQPTLPAPESTIAESYETPKPTGSVFPTYQTTQPKYAGPEPTIQEPQSTYPAPESTYPAPQSTYPAPQPTYTDESGPQPSAPEPEEPEPAHELGPDGYKYKVPSNKFKY